MAGKKVVGQGERALPLQRPWAEKLAWRVKRCVDVVGAGLLLLVSLPLWLPIALAIKLEDGGPVFYRFRVVGLEGRPFQAFKFRTMVEAADQLLRRDPELWAAFQDRYKLQHDPRVTGIGRWLRRLSLDELPQCLNVLRGEMSLVGPRAFAPYEAERFGPHLETRLSVKPGITGLWQVRGRHTLTYEERVRLDLAYIEGWSLGLDLCILVRTVLAVVSTRGAY